MSPSVAHCLPIFMPEVITMENIEMTKAVLVALAPTTRESEAAERALCELERLLDTAGGEGAAKMIQALPMITKAANIQITR